MGKRARSVKRPERDSDNPYSFSAEVMNSWDFTSTSPIHYGVVLSSRNDSQFYINRKVPVLN